MSDAAVVSVMEGADEREEHNADEQGREEDVPEMEDEISHGKTEVTETAQENIINGDQTRFMNSVQQSINVSSENNDYDSDESQSDETSQEIQPPNVTYDENYLKRKRKAMSTAKPFEDILKKRLLEMESSRLSACFHNADKKHKGDEDNNESNFLFLQLPLEDGELRSCGFNVHPSISSSIQGYLEAHDCCAYCIDPIISSEDGVTVKLGEVESKLHKSCAHFLSINALSSFIKSQQYQDFITAGKFYMYNDKNDPVKCELCDKGGGVLQAFSVTRVSTSALDGEIMATHKVPSVTGDSVEESDRTLLAHPVCITALVQSKQLELQSKSESMDTISESSNDSGNDYCSFEQTLHGGFCTLCGSHKGLMVTCGCRFCAVQAHYLCAKRAQWTLNQAVVGSGNGQKEHLRGDDQQTEGGGEQTSFVFLCPLHECGVTR